MTNIQHILIVNCLMLVRFKRVIYFISSLRPNKTQEDGGGTSGFYANEDGIPI